MFKINILSIRSVFVSALILMFVIMGCLCFAAEARVVPGVDLSTVVARVSPSVVSVFIKPKKKLLEKELLEFYGFGNLPEDHPLRHYFQNFLPDEGRGSSDRLESVTAGSGFFITDDGYIITNNHVIEDGASFSVVLSDETELPAQIVGTDIFSDLAILKVKSDKKFVPVEFEDMSNVRLGETVFTIGNPLGLRGSVNAGIVSALDRYLSGKPGSFIQIDAPINKGNSGGPCFNSSGRVIGVNNLILTMGSSNANMGIGFIVPASTVKKSIPSLISKGSVDHGWVGLHMQNLTQELATPIGLKGTKGFLVLSVVTGSPADKVDIQEGDVICALNGKEIKDVQHFAWQISSRSPKEQVELSLCKEGNKRSITVVLGTYPVEKNDVRSERKLSGTKELLGMILQDVHDGDKKTVRIVSLDSNLEAEQKGIQKGMDIISVNTKQVVCIKDVELLIRQAKEKKTDSVLLKVKDSSGDVRPNNKIDNAGWFVSLKIK
ncbi:trypsin-like peptidase domain-containing protein [Candidatus Liberibacter africanus]|uniref:Probable periplasmic serine endoprotease DegP-like n=1 Tax=Candidatus Liberibacter africanus PTSAPSY TaxID=1277257 RepID=A0A0G3I6B5_LIBAF|nr:trypsin-like peptidase domain-containing protein [Candidatus Liberibacter africanus]AKK19998.1 serine protease DO-like protease [Candidatus Liberibacter africanus PTSAPSY]